MACCQHLQHPCSILVYERKKKKSKKRGSWACLKTNKKTCVAVIQPKFVGNQGKKKIKERKEKIMTEKKSRKRKDNLPEKFPLLAFYRMTPHKICSLKASLFSYLDGNILTIYSKWHWVQLRIHDLVLFC